MKWREFVDKAIYPVGLASPALSLLQAWKIWSSHNASGVSLLAWTGWLVISFFWLNYGAHRKLWPIILVESLQLVAYTLIVVGIVRYG